MVGWTGGVWEDGWVWVDPWCIECVCACARVWLQGCTDQDSPLQVGVDAAEHEFPHDGGDGGEYQGATQDARSGHVVRKRVGLRWDAGHWAA